jgi:hypothetical protein
MRRWLTPLVAFFLVVACGSSSVAAGPSAASVALQSSDLPSGMHKCDVSGDIQTFLNNIKSKDASTYSSTKAEWDSAQKAGATAAQVVFFADTAEHCTGVASSSSQLASTTYKLAVSFVIQFKDEASAVKGYNTEKIFGFSKDSLSTSGVPAMQGKDTGLGPNSVAITISVANQSFYVAAWQNKAFMVILVLLNTDSAASKKAALAVNGRIH